jgi:co-chaperonin GroES (HSP10)
MEQKHYLMGDGKISEEESNQIKASAEAQEEQVKEISAAQNQKEEEKKIVTLEELLSTTMKPAEDRIVVWRDKADAVTPGGIIVPDNVREMQKPSRGTVIRVGPGKTNENLHLEILVAIFRQRIATPDGLNLADSFISRIKTSTSKYHPGDRILFGRFAGTPVDDPTTGEELIIMRPSDIFCLL